MRVYIGLGANVGDPRGQLRHALREIERQGLGRVLKRSHLYRTEPVGFAEQEWFINAAALLETELDLRALMAGLLKIEQEMGRDRRSAVPNGPRTIDLDILFAEGLIINEPDLRIPHPRAHLRRFVMEPAAELDPDLLHPELGLSASQLLEFLADSPAVEKLDELL